MKTRVAILAFIAAGFIFSSSAFSCPCHPCKCSPCTCGGMGSKSGGGSKGGGGKHHGDHHGGHDGGSSVGVGVSVDLSGVGHRTREADPFASGGNDKPVAHTEEKRTAKHKEHQPTTNSFDEIALTGGEAKDIDDGGSQPPAGTFNISDDQPRVAESPGTEEKPQKGKKPKPTWPANIQAWLDAQTAVSTAESKLSGLQGDYWTALHKFWDKSQYLQQLYRDSHSICDKISNAKAKGEKVTKEDEEACEKAKKAIANQMDKLNQDFDNTPEGKKALQDIKDAKDTVKTAQQVVDDAGKDIDQATKDKVLKKMEKWAKNQEKEGKKMAKE